MENFILYLLKATICLIVFGVFFRLMLMRETFFRLTRFTLLAGLVICSILPLIKINITSQLSASNHFLLNDYITEINNTNTSLTRSNNTNTAPHIIVNAEDQPIIAAKANINSKAINWFNIIVTIYWLGVALMYLRLGVSLLRLRILIKNGRVIEHGNYQLVVCKENIAPFSFFRYIAISEEDYKTNPVEIILHESIHIQKGHNFDLILSELLLVMHWFNPIMWMLNQDLGEIHEYDTDRAVIAEGISAQKYQLLLVKKAVGEKQFSAVVNSFNQPKLKNRITMMLKTKSTPLARLKVLFAVPLIAIALLAFATVDMPNNDKKERQVVADYFISLTNEAGKSEYDAYVYISKSNHLYVMTKDTDNAMINSTDLNNKDKLYESFVEIIDNASRLNKSNTISIALGADNDLEMKSVTIVRDVIRKSFDKWQSTISDDDKETHNKSQMMVLSLKLLSSTVNQEISTRDQVQANPLFYLQQAHEYFKNKGIQPKDITKSLDGMNKDIIHILVNSVNQTLIRNYKVLDPNELSSDNTIDALRSIIVNEWMKQKGEFVFFIQYDNTANSDVIMQIMKYTLPSAYDLAIQEIATKDNITLDEVKSKMPLILISSNDKMYNTSQKESANKAETKVLLHSVSGISEETKLVINKNANSTFPRNIEQEIKEYKDKYGITEISNLIIKIGINIDSDKIIELERSINKELDVKNIGYLLIVP